MPTLTYSRSSLNLESWSEIFASKVWSDDERCCFSSRLIILSIFLLSVPQYKPIRQRNPLKPVYWNNIKVIKVKEKYKFAIPKNFIFLSLNCILRSTAKRVCISCCFLSSSNFFSWASLTSGGRFFAREKKQLIRSSLVIKSNHIRKTENNFLKHFPQQNIHKQLTLGWIQMNTFLKAITYLIQWAHNFRWIPTKT